MAFAGTADAEDTMVDFSNASLYLSGMQTVFAVVAVACVSILSCWVVPEGGVSAVRTLAMCTATGAVLMRTPLRVGRAHGVNVVFSSLQPAVAVYIVALTVEQLVHTCATETQHSPSWRRVVFHGMIILMCGAGIMRARRPMHDTDIPFLITAAALLTIAVLPPPSIALVGPLCQPVSAWEAAERCLRSFVFAMLYCIHVYSSISTSSPTRAESMTIITRSAAAAIWAMGAHVLWLPAAIVQCIVVIMARIRIGNDIAYQSVSDKPMSHISDDDAGAMLESDLESVSAKGERRCDVVPRSAAPEDDPVEHQRMLLADPHHSRGGVSDALFSRTLTAHTAAPAAVERQSPPLGTDDDLAPTTDAFGPLRFRELDSTNTSIASGVPSAGSGVLRSEDMTAERMRDIVSALEVAV